ncbi:hypothetical protein, partial [Streptomyces sp. t39]
GAGRRSVLGLGLGVTALSSPLLSALAGASPAHAEPASAAATTSGPLRATDPGAYIAFSPEPGTMPLVAEGASPASGAPRAVWNRSR